MGKLKQKLQQQEESDEPQSMALKDEEFNYVMNVNQARSNINQEYNRVLSAFLHYVACNRGGFESTDNLKFELDFEDKDRILKVWKLEDDFYKPESD